MDHYINSVYRNVMIHFYFYPVLITQKFQQ